MKNRKFKKITDKSFYFILALCVLSVGAGVWGAVRDKTEADATTSVTDYSRITIEWNDALSDTSLDTQRANAPHSGVSDERSETVADKTEKQSETVQSNFVLPMGTDIIKDYSNGEMVRSKTMGDWRVHNGIDFAGAKGNVVNSVADGTVKAVYEDSFWGCVVEIEHSNKMTAKYCGLQSGSTVSVGDSVSAGDKVGTLGVVPCESADDEHLHFEVVIDGTNVDPLEALDKVLSD